MPENSAIDNLRSMSMFVKSGRRIVRIRFSEIEYIEAIDGNLNFHTTENKQPITAKLILKKLEDRLPPKQFMRIHRSYIVNLNRVNIIEDNRIAFENDVYIPISIPYREAFQKWVESNF